MLADLITVLVYIAVFLTLLVIADRVFNCLYEGVPLFRNFFDRHFFHPEDEEVDVK